MTKGAKKEFRQKMKVLKTPGLVETLTETREKGFDVLLILKNGLKAQNAGLDPYRYVAEHRERYRIKE